MTIATQPPQAHWCRAVQGLQKLSLCGTARIMTAHSAVTAFAAVRASLKSVDPRVQYNTCPEGYYSGLQLLRTHCAKDRYIWALTSEFATANCMPSEFVGKNLKWVEAVAYKPVHEGYECYGFSDSKEACGRGTFHDFEMDLRSNTKQQSAGWIAEETIPQAMNDAGWRVAA